MHNTEESLRTANLVYRFIADPASLSDGERAKVEGWIEESESHRQLYEDMVSGRSLERFGHACARTDRKAHQKAVEARLFGFARRRRRLAGMVAGAAAAVIAGLFLTLSGGEQPIHVLPEGSVQAYILTDGDRTIGLGGMDTVINAGTYRAVAGTSAVAFEPRRPGTPEPPQCKTLSVVVPAGGMYSVELEDGTRVQLNSGSSLTFPEFFGDKAREVELSGEGFFEVAPDEARLFTVRTGDMTTRALGTSFNVTAYVDNGTFYSTLVSGITEVSIAGGATETIRPGYSAIYNTGTGNFAVVQADTAEATAWRGGELIFAGMELEDILKTLSRWYDVDYVYTDRALTGRHTFAGKADRQEDLLSILRRLNSLGGPRLEINGRTITVNPS